MDVLYFFMIFAIVGWLWETPWVSIHTKKFVNRGFLHGPYIPIYGCAIVTAHYFVGLFNEVDGIIGVMIKIISIALITATWEFVTSYLLEKIFHTRWWDYSTHKFNLQGRISLSVTAFFGIGGYILLEFVWTPFDSLYNSISSNYMIILLSVFYVIFTIDSAFTLRDLFRVKKIMETIQRLGKELGDKLDERVLDVKIAFAEHKGNLQESIIETKQMLLNRYKKISETSVSKQVLFELEQIQNYISNTRSIRRFYLKYPHSSSSLLHNVKRFLKGLKDKNETD